MSNDLEIFSDILYLHLRPWKINYSEQKFRQLQQSMPLANYAQQPLYEITFPKPLTDKTKYYQALIENESKSYLTQIHTLITGASNQNEKKYLVHTALSKKLKDKLDETEKAISSHHLYLKTFEDHQQNKQVRENAYIIQYLKHQLIRLYLEIQDRHLEYLNDDPVTEENIHSIYFTEPFQSFIKPATELSLLNPQIQFTQQPRKIKFVPIKGDFKDEMRGTLTYDRIIKDSILFASFEEELYQVELIDEKYNFSNKHTEKQKLAAIYCVLIKKGYFKKRDFIKLRNIKEVDIRKFLDYRYNANVDAQFRHWLREPDKLAAYLKSLPWLNNLPLS